MHITSDVTYKTRFSTSKIIYNRRNTHKLVNTHAEIHHKYNAHSNISHITSKTCSNVSKITYDAHITNKVNYYTI
jgi:hypothetical protein